MSTVELAEVDVAAGNVGRTVGRVDGLALGVDDGENDGAVVGAGVGYAWHVPFSAMNVVFGQIVSQQLL